jgi:hypothetical protein
MKTDLEARIRELEVAARRPRRWWLGVLVGVLVAVPFGTSALGPVPHIFGAGEPIVAAEINENFDHLTGAIGALEEPVDFCGTTAPTVGAFSAPGGLVGFRAAGALCRTACGSPTAHMCTAHEVRVAQQNASPPAGWVATDYNSCASFTLTANTTPAGTYNLDGTALLIPGANFFGAHSCAVATPIVCCD